MSDILVRSRKKIRFQFAHDYIYIWWKITFAKKILFFINKNFIFQIYCNKIFSQLKITLININSFSDIKFGWILLAIAYKYIFLPIWASLKHSTELIFHWTNWFTHTLSFFCFFYSLIKIDFKNLKIICKIY